MPKFAGHRGGHRIRRWLGTPRRARSRKHGGGASSRTGLARASNPHLSPLTGFPSAASSSTSGYHVFPVDSPATDRPSRGAKPRFLARANESVCGPREARRRLREWRRAGSHLQYRRGASNSSDTTPKSLAIWTIFLPGTPSRAIRTTSSRNSFGKGLDRRHILPLQRHSAPQMRYLILSSSPDTTCRSRSTPCLAARRWISLSGDTAGGWGSISRSNRLLLRVSERTELDV